MTPAEEEPAVPDAEDQRQRIQAVRERSFQSRRFSDAAADVLRDLILAGALHQGERINEVVLAETLGISRTPVREALQALAGDGLVRMIPGRGAYVASLDAEAVAELMEVRLALESHAARLAADRITDDQLRALGVLLNQANEAVEGSGHGYPGDLDFHAIVLEAAGNSRLAQAAAAVSTQLNVARTWSGHDPERASSALAEHEAVHAALSRRDGPAAAGAMWTHLESSAKSVLALLAAHHPG